MILKKMKIWPLLAAFIVLSSGSAISQEEIQYKKFKLEQASCDVGLSYKKTDAGMKIGVSAIATGNGAQFRKWKVTDIKLNIDQERLRPDKTGSFFVREESFWRVPSAVLFIALGIADSGAGGGKGIGRAGMALGMGFLALAAKGDIEGARCGFDLDRATAEKIQDGRDTIEIRLENDTLHVSDSVSIGIPKTPAESVERRDYAGMSGDELLKLVDSLKARTAALSKEQESYKYGVDPEYDRIQRDMETLEAKRGMAYKVYLEKTND